MAEEKTVSDPLPTVPPTHHLCTSVTAEVPAGRFAAYRARISSGLPGSVWKAQSRIRKFWPTWVTRTAA